MRGKSTTLFADMDICQPIKSVSVRILAVYIVLFTSIRDRDLSSQDTTIKTCCSCIYDEAVAGVASKPVLSSRAVLNIAAGI